jgi:peptidase MA superfamily protein
MTVKKIICIMFILFMPILIYGETEHRKQIYLKSEHFIAEFPENQEKAAKDFLEMAENARRIVNKRCSIPLNVTIRLVYCPTERDFIQKSGINPEHFLACANPIQRRICINGERYRSLAPKEAFGVIVHEYAHVYIGQIAAAPLPRWLDEGIAQHLAGEWTFRRSVKLSTVRLFGNLIHLNQIDSHFHGNRSEIELAYIQSYSITEFITRRLFGEEGLEAFIRKLSSQKEGKKIISQLNDSIILRSIEEQWKASLGGRLRNIIFIFTSGSVLWFALASLFILAYLKKRRQVKEQLKIWEEEESYEGY